MGEIEPRKIWVRHSIYPTHTFPNRKETIAERGACRDLITHKKNWIKNRNFRGEKNIEYSGPLYRDFKVKRNKIQIYFDFSGYSDMAIGLGRMFGFELPRNFNAPYMANSITDFWRRWHISLSSWFRDYLYIPLGGSKGGKWLSLRNIFIIFLVSGFWHGANWTFIAWGAIHACFFIPLMLLNQNRNNLNSAVR